LRAALSTAESIAEQNKSENVVRVIRALRNPKGVEQGSEVAFGGELCRCSPSCRRCCTANCALQPRLWTCRRQCPLASRAWTLTHIVTSAPTRSLP
jgi:hypothetical protein